MTLHTKNRRSNLVNGFATRCALCIRQKKKCDLKKMLESKCINCKKYKKGKKACLIQCLNCYEKNKDVKTGSFSQCENCKEIVEDSPSELITCEEDNKMYFTPGDGNKYEIKDEIFEKIFTEKLKHGWDLGKFLAAQRQNFSSQHSNPDLSQSPTFKTNLLPTSDLNLPALEEFLGLEHKSGINLA
ncbi:hypothetical protein F8M41_002844 [Gigaspora margarita]|uniref:Uncharacterized protein n=1 Tax=Gigaspora margarita TaxID=4874 RepID=A0A8H3XEP3_GIGMA|nr:hypothetical protein F8M41_002844 [Gigaspora margarita]